ncbi:MAG: glycosyltransferase [Lachnospiraceae bacterium]|nr:glycosyltransferase [Lachnospiraceae bacterium]
MTENEDKTYVFVRGLYDTLDLFSEEIEAALKEMGYGTFVFNTVNPGKELQELLTLQVTKGIAAVIAFNNLAWNLGTKEGGNLWEAMGVPYVDILMDHPFHFDRILQNLPENACLFTVDRRHVEYVKRYYPDIQHVYFLPHAGCVNAISALSATGTSEDAGSEETRNAYSHASLPEPAADRDIDVLYAGALSRVLVEQLIPDFDSITAFDGAAFSGTCLDRLISEPFLTTEEVIREELKNVGLKSLSPEEERAYITDFRFLDGFAVSFYRESAVKNLVTHGIRVTTLGLGWETCDWADSECLTLGGKVSAKEVFSYMKRSKVVLSTQTWFKAGAHDRIFNGMLSGAAVVTDTSEYLGEIFGDTQCVQYDLKETRRLYGRVSALLESDGARAAMAFAGQQETLARHTWRSRAEELISVLERADS